MVDDCSADRFHHRKCLLQEVVDDVKNRATTLDHQDAEVILLCSVPYRIIPRYERRTSQVFSHLPQ